MKSLKHDVALIIAVIFAVLFSTAAFDVQAREIEPNGIVFMFTDEKKNDLLFCVDYSAAAMACVRVEGERSIEVCSKTDEGLDCGPGV